MSKQRSECHRLLSEIIHFDCRPDIFRAYVEASDHTTGFQAVVTFRTAERGRVRDISTHGGSPEEALSAALQFLKEHLAPCPHCGEYPTSAKHTGILK